MEHKKTVVDIVFISDSKHAAVTHDDDAAAPAGGTEDSESAAAELPLAFITLARKPQ